MIIIIDEWNDFQYFFNAGFLVITVLEHNQFSMLMLRIHQPFTINILQQMVNNNTTTTPTTNYNKQLFILTIFLLRQMVNNKPLIPVHLNMLIKLWSEFFFFKTKAELVIVWMNKIISGFLATMGHQEHVAIHQHRKCFEFPDFLI